MIQHKNSPSRPSFVLTVIGDRLPDLDLPAERRDEAGSGWVRRLRHLLMLRMLDHEIDLIDATEPANTVHRIRERWFDDVIARCPDVLVVHAGLSDAIGTAAGNNPYAKPAAEAVTVLEALLNWTRKSCPATRIILMEPFINTITTQPSPIRGGPWADALPPYVKALREMAAKFNITTIPAGELVSSAKHLRDDDDWLGCDMLGMDSNGSLLLAEHAARLIAPTAISPAPGLQDGQTLLFIGDSITDAGRRDVTSPPLGKGYLRLLQGLLAARHPHLRLNIINKGIGGDTIIDIENRWQRDVMKYRPDWLILYTGINDMNTIYGNRPTKILPEDYGAGLRRCLDITRTSMPATRFIVTTPFFLSLDECADSYRNEMLRRLPDYTAAATRHIDGTARLLHLQPVVIPLMKRYGTRLLGSNLGADNVHPGEFCQLALAEVFYSTLSS